MRSVFLKLVQRTHLILIMGVMIKIAKFSHTKTSVNETECYQVDLDVQQIGEIKAAVTEIPE